WQIASIRGDVALRSLSDRSGHPLFRDLSPVVTFSKTRPPLRSDFATCTKIFDATLVLRVTRMHRTRTGKSARRRRQHIRRIHLKTPEDRHRFPQSVRACMTAVTIEASTGP